MTKTSEEIVLEEVKEEYSRQLAAWVELCHSSHNFLQLNGLILTVVFIGMGIVYDALGIISYAILILSAWFIIGSILVVVRSERRISINEIEIKVGDKIEAGKEKDIIMSLIKKYNEVQEDIISKYATLSKKLEISRYLLISSLFFLSIFLVYIGIQNM